MATGNDRKGWRRRIRRGLLAVSLAVMAAAAGPGPAAAADSAVVFVYFRIGDDTAPALSVRIDQFEDHLRELRRPHYHLMALDEIVDHLRQGRPLPDRTVAVTIDGAHRSAYANAWPRLREAGIPFTLFVATDPVDQRHRNQMSWDEIRELRDAGVTIGNQTATHPHMARLTGDLAEREIERANARFEEELGMRPTLFAYPFGEYSAATRSLVASAGFEAAFGQHSGALHGADNRFALPRFSLNERYGDIDRFRLTANALPLPVSDVLPDDPLVTGNPPTLGFTVGRQVRRLDRLACFASGQGAVRLHRMARRFELRFRERLPPGRARLNCTAPGPEGRWRWFGIQFVVPE